MITCIVHFIMSGFLNKLSLMNPSTPPMSSKYKPEYKLQYIGWYKDQARLKYKREHPIKGFWRYSDPKTKLAITAGVGGGVGYGVGKIVGVNPLYTALVGAIGPSLLMRFVMNS